MQKKSTDAAHGYAKVFDTPRTKETIWLDFMSQNRLLVILDDPPCLMFWNRESANCVKRHELLVGCGNLIAFAMAPDETAAVSVTNQGELTVWDAQVWIKQRMIAS
jgi:hypothetical protein